MSSLIFRSAFGRANVCCDSKHASFAGVEAYMYTHTKYVYSIRIHTYIFIYIRIHTYTALESVDGHFKHAYQCEGN